MARRNHLPSSLFHPTSQILAALGPGRCPVRESQGHVELGGVFTCGWPILSDMGRGPALFALSDLQFLFVSIMEERVAYEVDADL